MNHQRIKFLANLLVIISIVLTSFLALSGLNPVLANPPSGHGGTFEDHDGNLAVNTAGLHDWNSPIQTIVCPNAAPGSGTLCGLDLVGSSADNSFGQGSKEDIPNPSVVSGSIPPNKSDLTRFYINSERSASNDFLLYLAWERSNVLGNANMDFEINQMQTPSSNGVTPIRIAGDVLITFDFVNGGGNPVLGLLTWVTSGATSQCFASNSLPCWGNHIDLGAANEAEGAVNSVTVHDANKPPVGGFDLPALTFGEVGVDLTESGIFPSNVCEHFGSAFLKSRSSASFTAELKDFIAPVNINISNCGNIIVKKVTVPSPDPSNTSFSYSLNGPNPPNAALPKSFSLANGGSNNTQVFAGSGYSVAETVPAGWTLTSAVCDNGNAVTAITVDINQTVTCTFTNTARGTLVVKKVTDPSPDPTNTSFAFTTGGGLSPSGFNLANGGSTTYSNLLPASGYSVSETLVTGWDLTSATCNNGSPVGNITVHPEETVICTFSNRARASILILKQDDASNPLAGAIFTAYDSGNNAVGTCTTGADGKCTISDLIPGTYVVKETQGVTGYDLAADQTVTLGPGAAISLMFVDPRQFTIIVLVCRVSDNTLYPSSVTVDGVTKTSLATGGGGAISDAALCGLGGASYGDKLVGGHPANVNIP